MLRKKGNKGFTIIELIVVIAVIAILIGLSVGAYKGYTKDAQKAEYRSNIKIIEQSSEQYYLSKEDWPRLTDEAMTQEQLKEYSEKIFSKTGEEVELEETGNYYEINYALLGKYMQIPKDKGNYIIQNPIGEVYYLQNITEPGKENLKNYTQENNEVEEPKEPEIPIKFYGLSPEAFDGDESTSYRIASGEITWDGDLDNREISITAVGFLYGNGHAIYINFLDETGNSLTPIGYNAGKDIQLCGAAKLTKTFIVPKGTKKIKLHMTSYPGNGHIYEVSAKEISKLPKEVTNIAHTSNDSSITLNWEHSEGDYQKAAIYRDNQFLTFVEGKTYTDKPLYANKDYTYKIIAINEHGGASSGVTHIAQTKQPEVAFRGSSPEAFDRDMATSTTTVGDITWEGNLSNKRITVSIYAYAGTYFRIYDNAGNILKFINLTDNTEVDNLYSYRYAVTKDILVPEGAVKINVTGGTIYEIHTSEVVDTPNNITNLQSSSTDSSITLNWENSSQNYDKAVIYRDSKFLTIAPGKTFTDKPLNIDSQHTYELRPVNNNGNSSENTVTITERTTNEKGIAFRGSNPRAFDRDLSTTTTIVGDITWEGNIANKKLKVSIYAYGGTYFRIYDKDGNIMKFQSITDNKEIENLYSYRYITTKDIIVPEGAVKFNVSTGGRIDDIHVID